MPIAWRHISTVVYNSAAIWIDLADARVIAKRRCIGLIFDGDYIQFLGPRYSKASNTHTDASDTIFGRGTQPAVDI